MNPAPLAASVNVVIQHSDVPVFVAFGFALGIIIVLSYVSEYYHPEWFA